MWISKKKYNNLVEQCKTNKKEIATLNKKLKEAEINIHIKDEFNDDLFEKYYKYKKIIIKIMKNIKEGVCNE